MIFNSLTFLIFLVFFVYLFWNLKYKNRIYLIFFSSVFFYGCWRLDFLILLIFSLIFNYYFSFKIYRSQNNKFFLYISIFLNLILLFIFKYLIFFVDISNSLLSYYGYNLINFNYKIVLPIGISFYTFQALSYTVDIYKKNTKPEKNFFIFSSYIIFFPQLVAGPILRANQVIPQLIKKKIFNENLFRLGFERLCQGLFLKCVLSNNISNFVDTGFNQNINFLSAIDVLTLSYLFGFQIYFDFAAYSHIAIGCALMIGIKFPENFNFPYHSFDPKEFWRRWHISLSNWVKDYIYIPLVKKTVKGKIYQKSINVIICLFITWLIMGLWHGASLNFLFWGIYHCCLIILFRFISFKNRILNWIIFLQLVMLSWVFFRSPDLITSFQMYKSLFIFEKWTFISLKENTYIFAFLIFIFYIFFPFIKLNIKKILINYKIYFYSKKIFYFLILIFSFIYIDKIDQFIYFQF